jgi:hypothetical protein
VLLSFQHFPGLPARARVLRFFGNATLGWAIALVVAAILLSLAGRTFPVDDPSVRRRVGLARTVVAAVAAFTVLSSLIDLITSLTAAGVNAGAEGIVAYSSIGVPAGIDAAFVSALGFLAVAVIAAATALWAYGLSRIRD